MRYIFAIILTLSVCATGYAAQLKNSFVDGTLGVGTNTPATKLHVVGTVTATSATIGGVVSLLAQDGSAFIDTITNPGMNVGIGTVTTNGVETIVKYNASSTFVVPDGVTSLKVLVVGGGAGGDGGVSAAVYGHGGGGGRVTYRSAFTVTPGSSHTVTIGTGGAAGAMDAQASPGVQSAFGSVTAAGGTQANNIGSGGDGGDSGNDINSVVTNYNGLTDSTWGGAGGAGAGGVGGTVTDAAGGTGGVGYSSSITGSSTAYGAGGDGSGTGTGAPSAVAANLGLGGHGHGTSPRAGGSGVVIIRFMTSYDMLSVNDRLRLDASGRLSVGGTAANNSLTVINHHVNGVGIDLRSDDTDLAGLNDFSVARLFADFTSGSYADSRLYLQTATGDNTWKTGLTIKDGSVGIGIGTPTTTLQVIGTVTATGFSGNGAGLTGKENTLSNSAGLAAALSDETGTNTVVFNSSPTLSGNINFPGSGIWNSSGNAGIGIASPASRLTIFEGAADGTGTSAMGIGFQYDSTFTRAGIYADGVTGWLGVLHFATNPGANSHVITPRMTIRDDKVGIGTTTPATALHVIGTVTATGFSGNGSGLTGITATTNANLTGHVTSTGNAAVLGSFSSANLAGAVSDETGTNTVVFSSSPTITNPTFTGNSNFPSGIWNSSGNVGIGTSTPSARLEVKSVPGQNALFLDLADERSSGSSLVRGITFDRADSGTGATIGHGMDNGAVPNWESLFIDVPGGGGAFRVRTGTSLVNSLSINSSGNVGIGTTTPAARLHISSGVSSDQIRLNFPSEPENYYKIGRNGGDGLLDFQGQQGGYNGYNFKNSSGNSMLYVRNDNVGIGTTTPNNILTLPIASATDPIADAWTLHCLADYKELGTETVEMIQSAAKDKIKNTPVSLFTKRAIITDEEAEREVKQKYKDDFRKSLLLDLVSYAVNTGVGVTESDNSYVDALANSMWETKADRLTIVEANKQKLISEKKALPKFQRKNYGIVAEDAPPEAQVLREDGSLQGVDTSVLIGILWANAQKQDLRISALESETTNLKQRLQTAGIP